jgi:hypothetical protein
LGTKAKNLRREIIKKQEIMITNIEIFSSELQEYSHNKHSYNDNDAAQRIITDQIFKPTGRKVGVPARGAETLRRTVPTAAPVNAGRPR